MNELQNSKNESDAINIFYILELFAVHINVIIIIPIITSIIGIIYALYFTSPIFVSTAKIMSSSSSGSISQSLGFTKQLGFDLTPIQKPQQWVYPEIIKSRTLARVLLKRKFDTKKFGIQTPLLKILTNSNDIDHNKLETIAINSLTNLISVYKNRGETAYVLQVSAFEPKLASDIAQAVIEELDNHQREYNNAKVHETRKFIEERIFEVGKELNNAEEALKVFRSRNRRIDNSPNLLLEQERLAREVTVHIGVFTTLKQQLETTKIDEVKKSDYVIVLDPPEVPISKSAPNRKQIVVLAGFTGISMALFFIFFLEILKSKKEDLDKIKSLLIRNLLDLLRIRK